MLSNSDMEVAGQFKEIIKREESGGDQPAKAEKSPPQQPIESEVEVAPQEETHEEIEAIDSGDDLDLSEEDTGQEDTEPRAPAIEPPAGLTAEENDVFRNSPPEVQKAWVRREQSRQKEFRRLQNEQAELRKSIEAEKAALTAERSHLSQQMSQYGYGLENEFKTKFADVTDAVALAQTDPVRFTEFQAYIAKIQHHRQLTEIQRQKESQEFQSKLIEFRKEENEALRENLKLDTEEKWNKFDSEITEHLISRGIPVERIQAANALELEIAWKAMKYDQAVAKRQKMEASKSPPPAYQKTGVKSNLSLQDESYSASMKRLRKSGSEADARAAFKAILAKE